MIAWFISTLTLLFYRLLMKYASRVSIFSLYDVITSYSRSTHTSLLRLISFRQTNLMQVSKIFTSLGMRVISRLGVLVIRPNAEIFQDLMRKRDELGSYDGGDTGRLDEIVVINNATVGFLNAYFSSWYTDTNPNTRLPFRYNAQRTLYWFTHAKAPGYWEAVAPHKVPVLLHAISSVIDCRLFIIAAHRSRGK